MNYVKSIISLITIVALVGCGTKDKSNKHKPVYQDIPYIQDYAVKYYFDNVDIVPQKISADRNGVIQVLASNKLYRANNGRFQYPGNLVLDNNFTPMADMNISDFVLYKNQFVYLTDKAILSNAWAGKLLLKHDMPSAKILYGGKDFDFIVSDGKKLSYIKDSQHLWRGKIDDEEVLSIKYSKLNKVFLILGRKSLYSFSLENQSLRQLYTGNNFTCFEILKDDQNIIIGTNDEYFIINFMGSNRGEPNNKLPWT